MGSTEAVTTVAALAPRSKTVLSWLALEVFLTLHKKIETALNH